MEEQTLLDWLLAHWTTTVVVVIGGIITVASAIVKATPTKVDDGWLLKILKFMELLSLNKKPVEKKDPLAK